MYNKLSGDDIKKLKQIVGENNVVTEKERMEDYSHDEFALTDIRKYPEAVVKPQNTEQISKVMKLANENNFAVTPRGAATGLCGG
ncbi:MAG: FAD-binding oxidoreductase, partial [Chlamydiae bacterium]